MEAEADFALGIFLILVCLGGLYFIGGGKGKGILRFGMRGAVFEGRRERANGLASSFLREMRGRSRFLGWRFGGRGGLRTRPCPRSGDYR